MPMLKLISLLYATNSHLWCLQALCHNHSSQEFPLSSSLTDYRPTYLSFPSYPNSFKNSLLTTYSTFYTQTPPSLPTNSPFCSTTNALIPACHTIQYSLNSSSFICRIFLSITKAFDSISHSTLFHKLSSINLCVPPTYTLGSTHALMDIHKQ